jgi:DNA-binding winged helix-turn-helix (wHTH) protein
MRHVNISGQVYEFGPFLLDVRERRLLRDGRPVQLRAKVLDTLRVLWKTMAGWFPKKH